MGACCSKQKSRHEFGAKIDGSDIFDERFQTLTARTFLNDNSHSHPGFTLKVVFFLNCLYFPDIGVCYIQEKMKR
eukprot:UN12428